MARQFIGGLRSSCCVGFTNVGATRGGRISSRAVASHHPDHPALAAPARVERELACQSPNHRVCRLSSAVEDLVSPAEQTVDCGWPRAYISRTMFIYEDEV